MNEDKLMPIHPGEVLLEEFIKPMNLSQNQIALALGVPEQCINEIVHGKRCITADIALRLARYFDMSPRFWLGLQMDYDLDVVEDEIGDQLDKEVAVMTVICAEKVICLICSKAETWNISNKFGSRPPLTITNIYCITLNHKVGLSQKKSQFIT